MPEWHETLGLSVPVSAGDAYLSFQSLARALIGGAIDHDRCAGAGSLGWVVAARTRVTIPLATVAPRNGTLSYTAFFTFHTTGLIGLFSFASSLCVFTTTLIHLLYLLSMKSNLKNSRNPIHTYLPIIFNQHNYNSLLKKNLQMK